MNQNQAQIFIPSPIQSNVLQHNHNIPAPTGIHLHDIGNTFAIRTKKIEAGENLERVRKTRKFNETTTSTDIEEAEKFRFGTHVAELMPNIAQGVNVINNNAILDAIQNLNNSMNVRFNDINVRFNDINVRFNDINVRFNDIDGRLDSMEARLFNASARDDNSIIRPPRNGIIDPHPNFPTTVGELYALHGARMTAVENYYGIPPNQDDNIEIRLQRIRRTFGVGSTIR